MKNELVYHRKFATRDQACKEITEYIEIFYNRQRTQERLDYLSPAAFTQQFHLSKIAALTRWRPRIPTDLITA